MKLLIKILLLFWLFAFNRQEKTTEIVRMHPATFQDEIEKVIPHYFEFSDTIPSDTLYEYVSANSFPIMYSRNIPTSVCIDGECRPVNIQLFWNNTGRYLGYKLPEGEFLSKTKHKPFVPEEYDRLHKLLGDPLSPLANYAISDLVKTKDTTKVDAVSSATIAAVLDYIVQGAVYTTYTLWHIVYGETKREIELQTAKKLNSEEVVRFLNSSILEDKVWVLNNIPKEMPISDELMDKLLTLVSGDDIYLAERALYVIPPNILTEEVQLRLVDCFNNATFLQKKLIAEKLKEAPELTDEATVALSCELPNLNAILIKNVLDLFNSQNTENEQVNGTVATLLSDDNRYIANQAFNFLESRKMLDKKTLKQLSKYHRKN